MVNTQLRLLSATAVAANFVNRQMTRSRSRRIVLFLDCCYPGAFDRGMAWCHARNWAVVWSRCLGGTFGAGV